jgi:hypothetical protein
LVPGLALAIDGPAGAAVPGMQSPAGEDFDAAMAHAAARLDGTASAMPSGDDAPPIIDMPCMPGQIASTGEVVGMHTLPRPRGERREAESVEPELAASHPTAVPALTHLARPGDAVVGSATSVWSLPWHAVPAAHALPAGQDAEPPRAASAARPGAVLPPAEAPRESVALLEQMLDRPMQRPSTVPDSASADRKILLPTASRQETHFAPVRSLGRAGDAGAVAPAERVEPARASGAIRPNVADVADVMPAVEANELVERSREPEPDCDHIQPENAPAPGPIAIQVLDAILDERGAKSPSSDSRPPQFTGRPEPNVPAAFLRTIRIELTPASLGPVEVVLKGGEASLRVRFEAEQAETVTALELDRAAIEQALTASGYALEEIVVARSAVPEAASLPANQATGSPSAANHASTTTAGSMQSGPDHRQGGRAHEPCTDQPAARVMHEAAAITGPAPRGERFLGRRALRSI